MSLLSDLSRGASNLPRNIRNSASTIGRALVSAADRYIGNGFRALGNGVVRISQLSARSYGHGILVTYNQTGGNDAIKLSDTPIQPDALNPFELFLHRSFSFAWLFGLLASAAAHSYRNSILMTQQTLNLALSDEMQLKQTYNDKRSVMLKYLLGFPGVLLGLPVSTIGFFTIVIGRVVSNSWETLLQFSMQLTNLALADEDKIKRADTRSLIQKYILGLPGLIPGVLAGSLGFVAVSIGRIVSNSWETLLQFSMQLTNIALAEEDKIKRDDKRSLIRKYVIGALGVIPGVLAGSVGFVAVSIGRVVSNSWDTLLQISMQLTNVALADEDKIKREDKRGLIRKYILGAFGVIPGVVIGSIGFIAVGVDRMVSNSLKTMLQVSMQLTNVALAEEDKMNPYDKRSLIRKYILGAPGIIPGVVIGSVGVIAVGVVRVINNSWETLLQISMQLTNLALTEEDKIKRDDKRSLIRKYILGAPGVIPGVLAGSVGFVAVSVGHVVSNSWETLLQISMQLTNLALADEDKIKRADTRSLIRKYIIGAPGLIPGILAGSVGFVAVSVGRVVSNSWQTMVQISMQLTNVALADEDIMKRDDKRNLIRKYVLGLPGLIPGVMAGSVGFVAVSFGRVVSNSWETLYSISTMFTNLALAEEDKIKREDKRGLIRKFLIGAPGTLAGIVVGPIGFVTVCVFRILGNSLATMTYLTLEITRRFINAALAEEDSLKNQSNDNRGLISKYILGIFGVMPGILVGTFTGIPGFTGVLIGRVLINSAKIFGDISGGIMNAALEREIFDGFSNKNTAERRWGLGFPGIVLATPVATIGITIFAIRKLLPLTFGVATSPITALWRISRETWKYYNDLFRFAKPSQYYPAIESKLKNLFASLTAMGELPEGKGVKDVRPGPIYTEGFLKNLIKFVRKSLTFNQQTLAEQLLSKLVHQFKGSTGSSGQNQTTVTLDIDNIVNQSIRDLMAAYAGDSHWITPDSEKREMDKEIIAIGDYVKDYFRNSSSPVPTHIYSARRTADFFFGKHKTVAAANAPLIQNTPTAEI